jgi:type I restriction enzyme S subunit
LEQLTEFITSGSRGWADYYADAGATFIRSQNINKDRLDLADIAFVNPPVSAEGARTRVQKEDLLLTITGANVGKTARVDIEIDEAFVSQHVALLRMVDSSFSAYLHVFLTTSAGGRGQLDKEAYGAGKPGLNLQQLSAVTVPLPSIHEIYELMKQVSKHLNSTTEQEFAIAASFKQSKAQRQNILKAAFSGKLVPQDPSDEPASELLARIRVERSAQQAVKKPRGLRAKEVA